MNFSEILKDKNKNSIRNIIKGYKDTSKESNQDVEINLGFAIPNYDIILDAIGCNDCGDPIINESFGDELYFKFLSIFKTELENTYFCRIEEYGPGDIDAMKCSIIITKEVEKKAKKIMQEYMKKSIIREKNKTILNEADMER